MYEVESSFSGNGFIPSTKRPFYDGVDDCSLSEFTIYDWLGVPNDTAYNLTTGFLIDFTIRCNTTPISRFEIGGVSAFSNGYSGILFWLNSSGLLMLDVYGERYAGPVISGIDFFSGIERRITIHLRIDGTTMFIKTYVDSVLKSDFVSGSNSFIAFVAQLNASMSIGIWSRGTSPSSITCFKGFMKQFDLFQTGKYSDAQVADYLADRDALNANLYARFLLDEGEGATAYAANDPTKELNHINITEPDFYQEY